MSDPTSESAGTSSGGNTGTVVTLGQLAAAVAALQGTVQTLTSQAGATQAFQTQIADGLKSLTENVNKLATTSDTDSDSGYLVRSSIDPGPARARLETYAELALSNAVKFQASMDTLTVRKISADSDHHDLGRFMPRSNSGPGSNDALAKA